MEVEPGGSALTVVTAPPRVLCMMASFKTSSAFQKMECEEDSGCEASAKVVHRPWAQNLQIMGD